MKYKLFIFIFPILLLVGCTNSNSNNAQTPMSLLSWDGSNYQITDNNLDFQEIPFVSEWQADIDYDNENENIILDDKRLSVYKNNKLLWQTDTEWEVENVIIDDLNQDGKIEINFSLWKTRGKYRKLGQFLESDERVNCFYIYKWRDGEIKPAWLSSPLDNEINKVLAFDINQDSKNELIVLENAGHVSVWSWNGWGFSNDFRSNKNELKDFYTDKENNTILMKE
jgi:hypothetical protein